MPDLSALADRLAADPPVPRTPRDRLAGRWARRRRRRGVAVGVTAAAVGASIAAAVFAGSGRGVQVRVLGPLEGTVQPARPTALAVGPDGGLYVADPRLNEILERAHDGRFAVVAGTGVGGFSGDGGPAVHASLNEPSGMAVGPDGTLYFADQGNRRVRAVGLDGTIRTVAGGGTEGRAGFVRGGTPALSASFSPSDVAFGPGGRLYIATAEQVLRLEPNGTVTPVAGAPSAYEGSLGLGGQALNASAEGPDGIAFDSAGDLYIAGSNTKSLLVVLPDGIIRKVAVLYPRGDGGLVAAPDGTVIAMDELSVSAVTPTGLTRIISFYPGFFHGVSNFSPDGIAVGADGTIYVDTFLGNGYTNRSAIAAVAPDGSSSTMLWTAGAQPPPPLAHVSHGILQGLGIGTVRFGQSQSAAVASLARLFGPAGPTIPTTGASSCGAVDTTVQWRSVDAYFYRQRFVGYAVHAGGLASAAGLQVGDTLAQAQHIYRSAVVTSFEQGGAWFVQTASGELEGFLSAEPNQHATTPRILTIEAGAVGCPAQTP